jgi:hypothetical protein
MKKLTKNREGGAALMIVVFFFVSISVAIVQSATIGAISELRTYRMLATSKAAYVAAEAGIEDVLFRIIRDMQIPATTEIVLNNATSTVTVNTISATEKEVYATGQTDSTYRKLYMKITKNINANLPYGAQVAGGGITLKNGAILGGIGLPNSDIYSNGQIVGAPNVQVYGNAISSSGFIPEGIASSTSCTDDELVGKTNPNIDFAQSFQISTTSSVSLTKVSLYIQRQSSPTGANIRITADASGQPATVALASAVLDNSMVATSYGWVDITFTSPPTLDPATTYWIVLDATQDNSKYWKWCRSAASVYTGGSPSYKLDWSTAGAWTAVAGDLNFKITLGSGESKIDQVQVFGTSTKADAVTNSTINGDAYYQTITGSTVTGASYPGSPTPPVVPLPFTPANIAQWKADAASGGVTTGNCGTGGVAGCNTFPLQLGARQVNGNLDVAGGETLTVNGTLYVTGNIDIGAGGGAGTVECSWAFLGNSCIIIADGFIRVRGGSTLLGSGSPGSFLMMLSTKTGCLGSGGTGCTTNDSAIALENSVSGALFYTTDSMIDISNLAKVTAVIGYQLQLQNGTKIIYDPLIADILFSPSATSSTGAWNINRWNEF